MLGIERNRTPAKKSRSERQSAANHMVMTISAIFVVLESPAFFSKALQVWLSPLAVTLLGIAANVCTTLESFSIFWAYILMNQRFRNHLLALIFCRHLCRSRRHSSSSVSNVYRNDSSMSDQNPPNNTRAGSANPTPLKPRPDMMSQFSSVPISSGEDEGRIEVVFSNGCRSHKRLFIKH